MTRRSALSLAMLLAALTTACTAGGAPPQSRGPSATTATARNGTTRDGMVKITNAPACRDLPRYWGVPCHAIQIARADIATCGGRSSAVHRETFGTSRTWPVLGPGPVYPVSIFEKTNTISFVPPDASVAPSTGGPWFGMKVAWLLPPQEYNGSDVLIRVFAVNHAGRAILQGNGIAAENLTSSPPAAERPGWPQIQPDTTLVTKPGCYAWRIEGKNFRYTIFFRARINRR